MKDNVNKKSKRNLKNNLKGGESNIVTVTDHRLQETVQLKPLEVKVYHNGFDKALRAFRALVQKERILSAYKEKQSYEKPSEKRRRKRNEMKRKLLELDDPKVESKSQKNNYHKKGNKEASPE